jgi:protein ImuB
MGVGAVEARGDRGRRRAGAAGGGVLRGRLAAAALRRQRRGSDRSRAARGRDDDAHRRRAQPLLLLRGGEQGAQIVPPGAARAFLAPLPVGLLRARLPAADKRSADVPTALERLGVRTLGALAALGAAELADRFGRPGLYARELAHGLDTRLRPRPQRESLVERLDLPEAVSGLQLDQMLTLLIDRLLARPERDGRSVRKLRLGARFVEQGAWRREVTLRQANADRDRLRLTLSPKLAELPAPIEQLSLGVVAFGPPVADQTGFESDDSSERRGRLAEALRQVRATAGGESVLRVLELDPGSRVPERRVLLTPFPDV